MVEGPFKDKWLTLAREGDLTAIRNAVISPNHYWPDERAINLMGNREERIKVLDFGCGICRNTMGMLGRKDWEVWAFDSVGMLEKARTAVPPEAAARIRFINDTATLSQCHFDAVLAALVLQHIDPPYLYETLRLLTDITHRLVVHSRWCMDDLKTDIRPILLLFLTPIFYEEIAVPTEGHFLAVYHPRWPKG